MAGIGDLLGGVAVGASAGYVAVKTKKRREEHDARMKAYDESRPKPSDAGTQGGTTDTNRRDDLEAGDKPKDDLYLADGGAVQGDVRKADRVPTKRMTGDERERLMLRENLPDSSGQNEYRMGHGQLDITSEQAMRGETPATLHFRDGKVKQIEDQGRRIQKGADMYDRYEHQYADGGLIAGAKKPSLKGVNAKPAPPSTRDAGKTPPPMIGVRADATAPDIRTEVDMLAHNPDNTVALADGGAIPGYATGGLLFGNYIPGGYNQHGSTTQTSDPLWHMECHRDFGKKG